MYWFLREIMKSKDLRIQLKEVVSCKKGCHCQYFVLGLPVKIIFIFIRVLTIL